MNTFLKYFLAIIFLLLSPVFILAQTDVSIPEAPKEGDIIRVYMNGYDIEAKITSVIPPGKTAEPEITPLPEPQTVSLPVSNLFPADIQQGLDNFAASNPIKNSIDAFDKKITQEAAKWYRLALEKIKIPETKKGSSSWTAGLLDSFKDPKNYFYLGLAVVFLTILYLWWKAKRRRDQGY